VSVTKGGTERLVEPSAEFVRTTPPIGLDNVVSGTSVIVLVDLDTELLSLMTTGPCSVGLSAAVLAGGFVSIALLCVTDENCDGWTTWVGDVIASDTELVSPDVKSDCPTGVDATVVPELLAGPGTDRDVTREDVDRVEVDFTTACALD
jgi:hypothetical protein